MAAPRGVELYQDLLVVVEDEAFEGLTYDDFYGGVVGLWDWVGFEVWLELFFLGFGDEVTELLQRVFPLKNIFRPVASQVDHSGHRRQINTYILRETVVQAMAVFAARVS